MMSGDLDEYFCTFYLYIIKTFIMMEMIFDNSMRAILVSYCIITHEYDSRPHCMYLSCMCYVYNIFHI